MWFDDEDVSCHSIRELVHGSNFEITCFEIIQYYIYFSNFIII